MRTIQKDSLEIFKTNIYIPTDIGLVSNNAYLSVVATNKCNRNCPYCINGDTDHTLSIPVRKMTKNVSELVNRYGVKEAIILGGEPMEPQNQVVRYRSFGSDPKLVTEMCRACAQGMLEEGVWPTYKHFPGHGSTVGDSHEGFALSNRTREELLSSELMPFADAASAGIPFIMSGHISFPNVTGDTAPASLSGELLTGLLREELGYDGILITDALNMGAVVQNYSIAQSAVMAVQAGNDMLLIFNDMDAYYQALLEAVRQGEIGEERIDESVERILRLKMG